MGKVLKKQLPANRLVHFFDSSFLKKCLSTPSEHTNPLNQRISCISSCRPGARAVKIKEANLFLTMFFGGQRWLKHPLKQNKGGLVSKLNSDIIKHPCISFHRLKMSEVESQLARCWDLDEATVTVAARNSNTFSVVQTCEFLEQNITTDAIIAVSTPRFHQCHFYWTSWGPLILIEFDHISPSTKMPEMQGHFGDRFPFLHDLFRL